MTEYFLTNGLTIPNDFPLENYEKIHFLVSLKKYTHRNEYLFFYRSWKGLLYRFLAGTEHDEKYRQSAPPVGENYSPHIQYVVERELFNFLVNGLSAIECLCYALFAIGAIEEVTQTRQATNKIFLIDTEKHIRQINPLKTTQNFEKQFRYATITTSLKNLFDEFYTTEDARKYEDWKKIRNVLIHRAQPGRWVPLSSPAPEELSTGDSNQDFFELWNFNVITSESPENFPKIEFNDTTTASRREWLTKIISNILSESYMFVDSSSGANE